MSCNDVVSLLKNHGCDDLTKSLDQSACSRYPVANGGLGDVFFGQLRDGTAVAIKTIRSYYEPGQHARQYHKRAAKEIYTWSKCKHPNVVQLTGLAVFRDCLAMISRWEDNGSLLQYLSRNPTADRCNLVSGNFALPGSG
ncbi:tyrosine kinase domain protein [Rhizoctonia solani 123E]|uniref:non-specific serine/threonine protein kinase n=1 Tax=Rhizoctonia solani 123E TaxID=1423351 RepID=A0A074RG90_9AGAM|nr:tyrosine kinase domain protein [Rhizoctonia solani 123E]